MKLVEINKMTEGKADVGIIIAGTLKKYEIGYSTAGHMITFQFPERMENLFRQLPPSIVKTIVSKVEEVLQTGASNLPLELDLEKEFLKMI